jgi:hypothetical protein
LQLTKRVLEGREKATWRIEYPKRR